MIEFFPPTRPHEHEVLQFGMSSSPFFVFGTMTKMTLCRSGIFIDFSTERARNFHDAIFCKGKDINFPYISALDHQHGSEARYTEPGRSEILFSMIFEPIAKRALNLRVFVYPHTLFI